MSAARSTTCAFSPARSCRNSLGLSEGVGAWRRATPIRHVRLDRRRSGLAPEASIYESDAKGCLKLRMTTGAQAVFVNWAVVGQARGCRVGGGVQQISTGVARPDLFCGDRCRRHADPRVAPAG